MANKWNAQAWITQNVEKQELSFLHMSYLYDLIYNPIKYGQSISKHVEFLVRTNSTPKLFQGKIYGLRIILYAVSIFLRFGLCNTPFCNTFEKSLVLPSVLATLSVYLEKTNVLNITKIVWSSIFWRSCLVWSEAFLTIFIEMLKKSSVYQTVNHLKRIKWNTKH